MINYEDDFVIVSHGCGAEAKAGQFMRGLGLMLNQTTRALRGLWLLIMQQRQSLYRSVMPTPLGPPSSRKLPEDWETKYEPINDIEVCSVLLN
jgi:hypothetical protein